MRKSYLIGAICLVLTILCVLTFMPGCGPGGSHTGPTPTPVPTQSPGSISGIVWDVVADSGLSGVTVTVYNSSSQVVTSGTSLSNGTYSFAVANGSGYRVEFTKTGYTDVIYYNMAMSGPTYLETIMQIDTGHSLGTGNIGGKIIDGTVQGGTTGVTGVTIKLRGGLNQTSGSAVVTTTSAIDGTYSFTNLPAGNYTAELIKTNWATTYFSVYCLGGITVNNQNATMTPTLSTGQIRIVLTWGATPSDLDSHLTGPLAVGDSSTFDYAEPGRFHTYWKYETYSFNEETQAGLDVDDTSSYGPETTTIYMRNNNGVYRFSVHDFITYSDATSMVLANSGAQVKVYQGSLLIASFNVPVGQPGTLWTVFELNGNTLTPINTIGDASSSAGVRSIYSKDDAKLIYTGKQK